ncbi:N-acetylmuramidase domain-containing protein [Shewanella livingstonensis]|uniref:DUF3380 domain-containing protein n=1 Tax=Shewanella livingstonensis TaxID=150120 RepID=A0A3G8LZQ7_9GAMM|nr:DUF3380 domain-containing protein [Shewanella livingstonensis]
MKNSVLTTYYKCNGSQYKQNKYDVKLQKAFEKYDKK